MRSTLALSVGCPCGIGPEVARAAREVIDASSAKIAWEPVTAGLDAQRELGTPLPPEVLQAIPVGEVITSGQPTTTRAYERFLDAVAASKALYREVKRGDTIKRGQVTLESWGDRPLAVITSYYPEQPPQASGLIAENWKSLTEAAVGLQKEFPCPRRSSRGALPRIETPPPLDEGDGYHWLFSS